MLEQHRLDLRRRDVRARRLDDVLQPADEVQRAVGVEPAEVAGVEEAVGVEAGAARLAAVAGQQLRPADADLALASRARRTAPVAGSTMRSSRWPTGGPWLPARRASGASHGHAVQSGGVSVMPYDPTA